MIRSGILLGALAVATADCGSKQAPATSKAPVGSSPASSDASPISTVEPVRAADAGAASTASDSGPRVSLLPSVDFGSPGTLVVVGYPAPIARPEENWDIGLDTYGFTDGGFAYCYNNYADNNGNVFSACVLTVEGKSTEVVRGGPPQKRAWEKEHGLTKMPTEKRPKGMMAPKLSGTWAFARDIRMRVDVASNGDCNVPSSIRIGGSVGNEASVWITTLRASTNPCNSFGWVEVLSLAPGGGEIGVAFRANGARWDSEAYAGFHGKSARIAAEIYNATGYRHHKAKKWPRAAELFLLAAQADPSWELPAYNLACAWARAADPRAEIALREAIARGGDSVKTRAQKDEDLAPLRETPWFREVVK